MIKKITLIIAVFAVQLLPAQVKWSNTNFFEQKNFIENKGQFESSSIPNGENILFLAKIDGVQYFFTNTGYTIARKELVKKTKADKEREDKHHWNSKGEEDEEENRYKFNETFQELNFVGANPTPSVETAHQVTNYYSYQDAKSPQRKGTIIAHAYPKITYKNMYPNIDVVFEFPKDSAGIEYSFIVHPGGDVENIKMAFPKNKELKIINNTIEIESAFGKIIHHQPTSFVENKKTKVNSSFVMKGNKVGFELGTYDKTKTLTIDPWTSVPSFAGASCAFDVDYDLIGNAYAYGGTGPFELVKFNTSGTLLWTFTAAFLGGFYYYGDFAVDRNTSNVYLTEGFNNAAGAGVVKISPGATVLATFGGNAQFNEMWRIAFSRCTNNAVIAGGGVSSPTYQTCFLDTNLLGITPVQYVVTGNCCHDVGLLALDNYGNSYQVTNQRVGDPIFDNTLVKLPLPAMLPITYSVSTNYAFREAASVQYYSTGGTAIANGYNGLTTSTTFVYTYDGYVLKKWDGPTGNLLVYHRMSFPPANDSSVMSWGGISADDCGNLFLGDNTNVRQFDANLTLVNTYPMTGTITDVQIANSGTLYVSGLGFVTTLTPTNIVNCQNSGVLALTATTVPATCNAPGSATAVVTGGNPPYNVVWNTNPPQFGLTISGVPPGTYTCTIQDGGCNQTTFIDSVTILSVGGVAATTSTTICTCGNNNGTATCTPTQGAPPYTYAWNNGQTTQTATGLAVGIYTCVITDSQGCTSTETLNVTSNNAVTLAYTATQTGCTTSTGTATITPTGGTLPYTYLWQNGQTTQTGTGFAIGTFSCVVTDGAGCAQLEYVNITATNPVLLSISSTPTGCTTSIGTATAIPSNGALPYTYAWSNGQTTPTATALGLGPISLVVTDANGCTQTQSTTIISNNPITVTFTQTPTGCTVNNGTATITASNGALPYTYSWTNGQTVPGATGLGIGSYTCTVTDANGCTHTQPVNIVSNNPVTLVMSTTPTGCTVNIGTATATAGNGALPYSYNWSNGQSASVATALGIGTYTVTVTDNNGCSRMDSIHVLSTNPVTMTMTSTQTFCTGQTGTATATPANGATPYTYLWSDGQTTQTATALDSGTYVCTATDANGCTHSLSVHITVTNPVTLTCDSTQTGCTPPTGTATANPANGTAPYIYSWSNGQTSQTASGLVTGGYIVTVTDNNGCTATGSTTVTQYPLPIVTISPASITITSGESATLNATGGTSYHWYPSDGLSCATCPSTTATPGQPTTYCVAVKDVHGCKDSTCVRVDVLCNAGLLDKLIPTAFSPNNDGMNDVFCMPDNTCINSFELDIYDRWGEKVFMTTDINNCWDGTYKGASLGTAAFVYIFEARLSNGQVYKQKGTVSLIK